MTKQIELANNNGAKLVTYNKNGKDYEKEHIRKVIRLLTIPLYQHICIYTMIDGDEVVCMTRGNKWIITQYLNSKDAIQCTDKSIQYCLRYNLQQTLKMLVCDYNCPFDNVNAADTVVTYKQFEMLQWLYNQPFSSPLHTKCTSMGADIAASKGELRILQWLINQNVECTEYGVDCATEYGHVEMLDWLFNKYGIYCSKRAIEKAICNGHDSIVYWVDQNKVPYTIETIIAFAYLKDMYHLVNWLLSPMSNTQIRQESFDLLRWSISNPRSYLRGYFLEICNS